MNRTILCPVVLLGWIVAVHGQTRTSPQYGLAQEAANGGGGSCASARYAMEISLEGCGGVATSAVQTAKSGYLGQLYTVAGLNLAAYPTTVNEGDTRALSFSATLDDASVLPLPAASAKWSVVTGPMLSVDTLGLAHAGQVYQTTPATLRADYQGKTGFLTLQVLNVTDDDWGLYANDGLPDSWQVSLFGENNPQGRADADPDHDGQNNLLEYLAGTSPVDGSSSFRLSVSLGAGRKPAITFSPCLPSRTYVLEATTNLTRPFASLTTVAQSDNGFVRTVTDTNSFGPIRFYRVRISR